MIYTAHSALCNILHTTQSPLRIGYRQQPRRQRTGTASPSDRVHPEQASWAGQMGVGFLAPACLLLPWPSHYRYLQSLVPHRCCSQAWSSIVFVLISRTGALFSSPTNTADQAHLCSGGGGDGGPALAPGQAG